MMKRIRENEVWFEFTEHAVLNHGFMRFYLITCHKCGKKAEIRSTGQSNDMLRRYFMRHNWDVGRAKNLHVCPECSLGPAKIVQLRPESPAVDLLQKAWEQATTDERTKFLLMLETKEGLILARSAPPAPAPEAPPSTHIDSMPVEQPQPPIEHPVAMTAEPDTNDDTDNIADWWKEMHSR